MWTIRIMICRNPVINNVTNQMNAVLQNKTALDFMRIIRTIMAKTRPQLKKEPHETSKVLLLACLYNQILVNCACNSTSPEAIWFRISKADCKKCFLGFYDQGPNEFILRTNTMRIKNTTFCLHHDKHNILQANVSRPTVDSWLTKSGSTELRFNRENYFLLQQIDWFIWTTSMQYVSYSCVSQILQQARY